MPIYRVANTKLEKIEASTFVAENLQERQDLQRLIKADIGVLGDDLKVIDEEFQYWQDAKRRIDLLCLDKNARLVVVEIKRTDDGGHMELQALRYAAMVSSMKFEDLVDAYALTINDEDSTTTARSELLKFPGWESGEDGIFNDSVRIILVSANFSTEITTAVLWLNKMGLEIQCVRIQPYRIDGSMVLDIQQIIPLPEAAAITIKIRAKEQEDRKIRARNEIAWSGSWYCNVDEGQSRSWKDMRKYGFIAAGGGERWTKPLQKLEVGAEVYAYQSGAGYVGYGVVSAPAIPAKDCLVNGTPIGQLALEQPGLMHNPDDSTVSERRLVQVDRKKTYDLSEAKTFKGIFANPASVCKLRDIATIRFLKEAFATD